MTAIIWQDITGSTNDDAKEMARQGEFGPVWIGATQQTKGRGRRGRSWESPPGNLYASHLAKLDHPLEVAAQFSFVAALAVYEMARALLPPAQAAELQCKWPNDLLLDGRKFCGILIESGHHRGIAWLVVGIGVNLIHAPKKAQFPATALGIKITPQDALKKLAAAFTEITKIWDGEFANISQTWLAKAVGLGKQIEVHLIDETLSGTFDGLNPNGALLLSCADGTKHIIEAGDVFFKKTHKDATCPIK